MNQAKSLNNEENAMNYFFETLQEVQFIMINFINKKMSDKHKPIFSRMTIDQLGDSSNNKADQSKYKGLKYSSEARNDRMDQTYDQTHDQRRFKKDLDANSPLDKYKMILASYQKQFITKPTFKQAKFIAPQIHRHLDGSETKQKENDNLLINNYEKYKYSSPQIKSINGSQNIQWKTATKKETAEIVRKLYATPTTDYNFQYRKKKFFENFSKKL